MGVFSKHTQVLLIHPARMKDSDVNREAARISVLVNYALLQQGNGRSCRIVPIREVWKQITHSTEKKARYSILCNEYNCLIFLDYSKKGEMEELRKQASEKKRPTYLWSKALLVPLN